VRNWKHFNDVDGLEGFVVSREFCELIENVEDLHMVEDRLETYASRQLIVVLTSL
jgi:hypothetical protein